MMSIRMSARMGIASAAAAAALGALIVAAPSAEAAPPVQTFEVLDSGFIDDTCLDANGAGNHAVKHKRCTSSSDHQKWYVDSYSDSGSHNGRVVRLRNKATGKCLDSNGGGNETVQMKTCNNGNYQRWEIHTGTEPFREFSTIVFKSWGAWKHHGAHKCIEVDHQRDVDGPDPTAVWTRTCDVTNWGQQFH